MNLSFGRYYNYCKWRRTSIIFDICGLHNCRIQTDKQWSPLARKRFLDNRYCEGRVSQLRNLPIWQLAWSARSLDFTAPNFFLCSYLKSRFYANKSQTIAALKENIRHECEQLSPEIMHKVMENAIKRALMCIKTGGSHLTDHLHISSFPLKKKKVLKKENKDFHHLNYFFYLVKKLPQKSHLVYNIHSSYWY